MYVLNIFVIGQRLKKNQAFTANKIPICLHNIIHLRAMSAQYYIIFKKIYYY